MRTDAKLNAARSREHFEVLWRLGFVGWSKRWWSWKLSKWSWDRYERKESWVDARSKKAQNLEEWRVGLNRLADRETSKFERLARWTIIKRRKLKKWAYLATVRAFIAIGSLDLIFAHNRAQTQHLRHVQEDQWLAKLPCNTVRQAVTPIKARISFKTTTAQLEWKLGAVDVADVGCKSFAFAFGSRIAARLCLVQPTVWGRSQVSWSTVWTRPHKLCATEVWACRETTY